ncbi:MAG TPA: NADH-ubiquinone oxidoreductase-F iron-sulfur binding region domain-containing protein [Bacteroidales bacterium]|nr:NADH-ubiquinone oxidoreductase-F iron-sulfur binding region domain-containing protein [Bacteroidales bacterium]
MNNIVKEILLKNVLIPTKINVDKKVLETLQLLKREKVIHPVITISSNTPSKIAGIDEVREQIEDYINERNLNVTILEVGSLGLSSLELIISVQLPGKTRLFFKQVNSENIILILDGIFNNFIQEEYVLGQLKNKIQEPWAQVPFLDEIAYFNFQQRLILNQCGFIDVNSIDEYIAFGGYQTFVKTINQNTPGEVCDIVEESLLRGRGGEGYSTGKKWKIASSTVSPQKYLICNAGESDPGAFMERLLMESDPHNVIEGIAIAAYAISAQKAFIYIESDYELAIQRIRNAIDQATAYGLLGHDIMGTGYNLEIIIKQGAGAYVCGEETALIKNIEGKRGKPHSKPPYPATKGLFGQPTVVNNVETLVNVPVILDKGAEWFKSIGTEDSKGTKVFSISGKVEYTGLVEVEMGTKIRDVIFRIAGGIRNNKRFKAVHIGGPSGGCLTEDHLDTLIDFESIMLVGASLGAASLVVLDEDNCILDTVKYFMDYLQKESCGICIPCREGTRRMAEILENISKRPKDENGYATLQRFKGVMQLETLAEVLKDTSMCGLGRKAANPVLSTLKWFRDEYEEHIFERNCSAGVCQELRTFEIDVDACTGCTLCAKKCPTGAIFGTPKNVHFIVQDKCIGCGICFETCKFSAIISK